MTSVASSFMGGSQHQPRTSCCQTGYPVLADPLTGRTICSCQLQSGVPAYLSRVPSLPETVYPASSMHLASLHRGSAGTYPGGYSMSDSRILKAAPPSAHIHSHYEAAMAASPYAFYPGFDINGVRRKNATRESTAALKAWLYQHRKNPYPTKAEKVMLAIISQMTLTQVSTWFANARRRLKKERKLGDNDLEDLDDIDVDGKRSEADTTSSRLSDCESDVTSNTADNSRVITDLSDVSDAEEQTPLHKRQTKNCVQRLFSPDSRNELYLDSISSPNDSKLSDSGPYSATKEGKDNCLASNSKCKSFQDDTSTISNCSPTPCVPKNDFLTLHKSNIVQNNHTKSKIWSIDSIIG